MEWSAWLQEKLRSPVGQIMVFMVLSKLVKWMVRRFGPQEKDVPLGNVKRIHSAAEWDMWLKDAAAKKQLLIADFTATWCGPCKRLKPQLVQLSELHVDTVFVLVDVDACKDVSRANSITCMPTVKAFRDGTCVETLQGATAAAIAQAIKKHS